MDRHVVDAGNTLVTAGRECGLFIDIPPGEAVAVGDWIATDAGSRYLVTDAKHVHRTKTHAQRNRFRLRCARLPKHTGPRTTGAATASAPSEAASSGALRATRSTRPTRCTTAADVGAERVVTPGTRPSGSRRPRRRDG